MEEKLPVHLDLLAEHQELPSHFKLNVLIFLPHLLYYSTNDNQLKECLRQTKDVNLMNFANSKHQMSTIPQLIFLFFLI